jgi:hypothetical protein
LATAATQFVAVVNSGHDSISKIYDAVYIIFGNRSAIAIEGRNQVTQTDKPESASQPLSMPQESRSPLC